MKRINKTALSSILFSALLIMSGGSSLHANNQKTLLVQKGKKEYVTARGVKQELVGHLPQVGKMAPLSTLTDIQLTDVPLTQFKGKVAILNIFPSLDTPTCSASVHHFNDIASKIKDVAVLCISMDLPFAAKRFCSVQGLNNVITLSGFRSDFGKKYGIALANGKMKDLYARAVVVIDKDGKVAYTQLVPELSNEPNYDEVLEAVNKLK